MKAKNQLWYGAAGLVIVSIFFLIPPWTTGTVIAGIVPLLLLAIFGFTLHRAKKRQQDTDVSDEPPE
jgi:hypothetical protein